MKGSDLVYIAEIHASVTCESFSAEEKSRRSPAEGTVFCRFPHTNFQTGRCFQRDQNHHLQTEIRSEQILMELCILVVVELRLGLGDGRDDTVKAGSVDTLWVPGSRTTEVGDAMRRMWFEDRFEA